MKSSLNIPHKIEGNMSLRETYAKSVPKTKLAYKTSTPRLESTLILS